MTNTYLRRKMAKGHACEASLTYNLKQTNKCRDDLVYIYNGNYRFFRIVKLNEIKEQPLTCVEILKTSYIPAHVEGIPWARIGVFTYVGEGTETVFIKTDQIAGKVVMNQNGVLKAVSRNLLHES